MSIQVKVKNQIPKRYEGVSDAVESPSITNENLSLVMGSQKAQIINKPDYTTVMIDPNEIKLPELFTKLNIQPSEFYKAFVEGWREVTDVIQVTQNNILLTHPEDLSIAIEACLTEVPVWVRDVTDEEIILRTFVFCAKQFRSFTDMQKYKFISEFYDFLQIEKKSAYWNILQGDDVYKKIGFATNYGATQIKKVKLIGDYLPDTLEDKKISLDEKYKKAITKKEELELEEARHFDFVIRYDHAAEKFVLEINGETIEHDFSGDGENLMPNEIHFEAMFKKHKYLEGVSVIYSMKQQGEPVPVS